MSKRAYEKRLQAKREAARAARKRAEKMRKIRIWVSSVVAVVALGLTLLLCLPGGDQEPVTGATPLAGCTGPTPGPPAQKTHSQAPAITIDTKQTIYVATLATTCGNIKISMDPAKAPTTVNNFVFLAKDNFYDGTKFHRVQNVPGDFAIVQGGDPQGTGRGGPGYTYPGETPPAGTKYKRGVVAMANSGGPSSNGSQFFIVARDWDSLPPNYTVFGEVIDEGDSFATLDRMIAAKGTEIQGGLGITPEPPIFVINVVVEEFDRS